MASVRLFAQRQARIQRCKSFVEEATLECEHVEGRISGPSSAVEYESAYR